MNWKLLGAMAALIGVGASVALGQGTTPTIVQGDYISNVFGQSNFIKNPNAKLNTNDVTVSSATVSRSPTTPLVATSEFNVAVTSANGTATWATRAFDAGMKNNNCEARFTYRGFAATSKVHIKQGANTVATLNLTPATDPRIASINFPCGDLSAATTFVITDTSTLGGVNEIGGIYVGLATNQANVAQAEMVVSAYATGTQSLTGLLHNTLVFGAELKDAYAEFDPATGIFTAKRAGDYQVTVTFSTFDSNSCTVNTNNALIIIKNNNLLDASNSQVDKYTESTSSVQRSMTVTRTMTLAVGDTIRSAYYPCANTTKAGNSYLNNIQISRFPTSSELVVTPERQNTFGGVAWSGNIDISTIGATTNTIINTTNFGTPIPFGKATIASTSCGLTANDVGVCFENVPPGTYEVTTSFEQGAVYSFGTAGATACSARIHVSGTSFSDTSVASAFTEVGAAGQVDWVTLSSGVVTISSFQPKLALVLKQSKSGGNGRCLIRSSANGTTYPAKPTITFKPLDQPSNSALYVQGPVKASATGATIAAGYVGETIEASGSVNRTSGTATNFADVTGMSVTVTPGVWLICAYGTAYFYNAGSGFVGFEHRIYNSTDATQFTIQSQRGRGYGNDDSASFTMCKMFKATASKTFVTQTKVKIDAGVYTYGSQYAEGTISAVRLN